MLYKQNKIDELDKNLPNYIHLVNKINSIYDSIINNDKELRNQKQKQVYKEKVEQKERANDNPESFKDTLKIMTFNISEDIKDEIDEIKMDLEQNYEKYINENVGKKKIENIEQDIR